MGRASLRGLHASVILVLTTNNNVVASVIEGRLGGRLGGRRGRAGMTTASSSHTIIQATTRRRRMAAFVSSSSVNNNWKADTTPTKKTCPPPPMKKPSSLLLLSAMMQSSMTSVVPFTNRGRGGDVSFNGFNIIQQQQQRQQRSNSLRSCCSLSLFSSASANNGRMTVTGTKTTMKSATVTTSTTTVTTTLFDQIRTLLRVLLPSIIAGLAATFSFTWLCQKITILVISSSSSSEVVVEQTLVISSAATSTFVNLIGLLYSILMGQLYSFLYGQQESLYYALYDEVTEAKSLLEQVGLLASGRVMYRTCLDSISRYIKEDLLGGTTTTTKTTSTSTISRSALLSVVSPSILLSARPTDDPLESILYLTSVGIPSQLYDTVRSLRQARSRRLGALQRKVPLIHLVLLSLLGSIMLASIPISVGVERAASVIAAATTGAGGIVGGRRGGHVILKSMINRGGGVGGCVLSMQSMLFGIATFAVVMTKMVLIELWRMKSRGAYSVDKVLRVMVHGLQCELDERMMDATATNSAATMTIDN